MKPVWYTVVRKKSVFNYEKSPNDIASWLAKHAGTHGLNGDWYMTSSTKRNVTTYFYRFKEKGTAMLFKLTFGGTL